MNDRIPESLERKAGELARLGVIAKVAARKGLAHYAVRLGFGAEQSAQDACAPQGDARRLREALEEIGARLPCNVVVRTDESGKTIVEIMAPRAVLELVGRPEITKIAGEVRSRLERVLAAV